MSEIDIAFSLRRSEQRTCHKDRRSQPDLSIPLCHVAPLAAAAAPRPRCASKSLWNTIGDWATRGDAADVGLCHGEHEEAPLRKWTKFRVFAGLLCAAIGCSSDAEVPSSDDPETQLSDIASDCPVDTTQPIPEPSCPSKREPLVKWSDRDESRWTSTSGPHRVLVRVSGGRAVCPAPTCPTRPNPCPEYEAIRRYSEEWNWRSQRCVRALITDIGGTASEERFWVVNVISAELTWQQIQNTAMHPHVENIGSAEGGSLAAQPVVVAP